MDLVYVFIRWIPGRVFPFGTIWADNDKTIELIPRSHYEIYRNTLIDKTQSLLITEIQLIKRKAFIPAY
jgi:hypothetical protein